MHFSKYNPETFNRFHSLQRIRESALGWLNYQQLLLQQAAESLCVLWAAWEKLIRGVSKVQVQVQV
jgi:hypothetical protein